ncbi:MAG: IS110 family transposase [Polyangiales bacterium]
MDIMHAHCAGLDVHKATVVACVRHQCEDGRSAREVRTFDTTTSALLELRDWLESEGCTHVAMEATGVYWKPVWHMLESDDVTLVLANAQHVRNVPGRKSDVNDATWIADLLAHGLIRASFVPPVATRQMRDLTRTRKQLTREIVQHTQRIQRTLEDANVKIDNTISNVLGVSGRRMMEAIIAGESDPERLADLASTRIKASRNELVEALRGRVLDHHRFLLKAHLGLIDALTATVRDLEARMGEALAPFREQVERLTTIPGVSRTTAEVIAAEVGFDMSRFATAAHLVSWAGLCPRMDESAGKRRSTRIRKGAPWLKTMLVQAAWAASRKKESYTAALFARLRTRRGAKKAAVAVAASLLTAVFHMLTDGTEYRDLGPNHFDQRDAARATKRLIRRLEALGHSVELKPAAAA